MKEFTEALKSAANEIFKGCSQETNDAIEWCVGFAASWRPAPPAPGVDTSPAALRELADQWDSTPGRQTIRLALRGNAMEAALRAVAAEKEEAQARTAVPQGWRLVPEQRLKNARALVDRGLWVEGANILDEVLAAAPEAPQAPASAWRPMSEAPKTRFTFQIGGKYNWKGQPERLVYLGKKGCWNQFAKTDAPDVVWCEVTDDQLRDFEETLPSVPAQEGGE